MRVASLLTFSALTLAASSTASAGAFDFFPLEAGNVWVYATAGGHHVVRVNDGESLGSGWYASDAEGLLSGSTWIYDNTESDEMLGYSAGWSSLFDFSASVGDTWAFQTSACDAFDVEVGDGDAAVTPAGDFSGITEFILTHSPAAGSSCATPPLATVRFAEGVGPVHFTDGNSKPGKLMYARVGGAVEAMAPGDTGTTDDLELSMVITDSRPSASGSIGVLVVLTNTSSDSQTITMPQGQPFVIDIFERFETTPVGTWSGGTGGEMTLSSGDSHILFGEVTVDGDWSGAYTVEGSLSSDAGLPELSVDIQVQ